MRVSNFSVPFPLPGPSLRAVAVRRALQRREVDARRSPRVSFVFVRLLKLYWIQFSPSHLVAPSFFRPLCRFGALSVATEAETPPSIRLNLNISHIAICVAECGRKHIEPNRNRNSDLVWAIIWSGAGDLPSLRAIRVFSAIISGNSINRTTIA